ncbi:IclR family transcriptional regulator [Agromyces bracchium]|uniref:Helix-turn-helix domain-containing protein n=1 Tax=Agromyces bracchium TaxID=88376 RepID=A0A6I3M476_9MICO|nr:helix-turn-helix domain-containing protein [Agromyces bracchium]
MARRGYDERSVAEKLFAIADAFERGDELTLSEIAARARLPMSTAHRLVGEWVEWGGLVRADDGTYRVGIKLWRLSVRQPSSRRLRTAAKPYLEDLLESTGEHVHLAVRDGLGVVYLEWLSGADAVHTITDVGSRLPLHATGVGQALLAFAPPGVFEDVIAAGPRKYLPGTIVEEDALRARMAEVRRSGIATSVEAMTEGAFSVAAPVRDASGEVVAAVSIIAHVERLREPQFALGVRIAGRGISAALGWRG